MLFRLPRTLARRDLRIAVPLPLAAAFVSCSLAIDVGDQCSIDDECKARGPEFSKAECVNQLCIIPAPDEPETPDGGSRFEGYDISCKGELSPGNDPEETVAYSLTPTFAAPVEDPKPFTFSACERFDPDCQKPVDEVEAMAGELLVLKLPLGFEGYFRVLNEDTPPLMVFLGSPVLEDTAGWDIIVPDNLRFDALISAASQEKDLEAGHVIAKIIDCERNNVTGASIATGAGGVEFYIINTLPTTMASETDESGNAGILNATPGTTLVTAVLADEAWGANSAVIRKGWISYVEISP